MIMKRYFILAAAVLLVLPGCSGDRTHIVRTDDLADTLKLQELHLPYEFLMPARMIASCGDVVIYQRKVYDTFVLVDMSDGGNCTVIGRKGRGPGEFTGVDVQSLKPADDGFICMDAGGKVKKVCLKGEIDIRTTSSTTFGHPQNGIFVGDKFISANVVNTESEYIVYSPDSESPRFVSEYPDWTGDTEQPLPFTYMKNMTAHPDGELFASFYVYFRKFRIYDADGNLLHDVDVRFPEEFPAYSSDPEKQHFAYASYPCATEKHIYALCRNSGRQSLNTGLPEIQVWDWSGKLKKRYVPDRHIDLFAVDEERGVLFGMDTGKANVLYYQHIEL